MPLSRSLRKSIKFDRFAFSFAPDLNGTTREAHSMQAASIVYAASPATVTTRKFGGRLSHTGLTTLRGEHDAPGQTQNQTLWLGARHPRSARPFVRRAGRAHEDARKANRLAAPMPQNHLRPGPARQLHRQRDRVRHSVR